MVEQKYDIYILSYGVNPYRDISLASLHCLKKMEKIYFLRTNPNLIDFLQENKVQYKDISHLYKSCDEWGKSYERISDYIIEEGKIAKGVCYLTYGNPMLFDKPVELIIQKASEVGLTVFVLPAISFVDVIISYKGISIGKSGLAVYDSNYVVDNNINLITTAHCFLAQVGIFGYHYHEENLLTNVERLTPLIRYLRKWYPADHKIIACDSDGSSLEPVFSEISLCYLQLLSESFNYSTTIYIPPIKNIVSKQLLKEV